jgi:hypothetical protein
MSDASNKPGDSVRELLLGMGGSSMRKSYYPELRSKLDDLELFHELVERSTDAILLFSLPIACSSPISPREQPSR